MDPSIIENNPTDREYFIIGDFTRPPVLDNNMSVNYTMWDKANEEYKWVKIQYQNTDTEELLKIENLKVENDMLENQLQLANEKL